MRVRIADLKPSKFGEKIYSTAPTPDLIESIRAHGVLVPIWLAKDNTIIAGHRRVNACKALGIEEIEAEVKEYSDLLVIESNRYREKTCIEKLREAEAVELIFKREAKEQQGARTDLSPELAKSPIDTREETAKAIGVSHGTLDKLKSIQAAKPELLTEIDQGKKSVDGAYRLVRAEGRIDSLRKREVPIATGEYESVVIDPPWPIEKIPRDVRQNQVALDYPTMTEEELQDLVLPLAADSHVWLWTTQKFLPMALRLLAHWGLKYVCTFVWHKPGGFQPYGLPQYNCEFVLYARKGAPVFTETKNFFTCFNAPRGKHSEKPADFYDAVRRVTAGPRLDMFSRRTIEGFEGWGNEAGSAIPSGEGG